MILSASTFIACSNEKLDVQNFSETKFFYTKNNFEVSYDGSIENNHLQINLKINNFKNNKSIEERFDIDLNNPKFPKEISKQITLKQNKLSNDFTESEIGNLIDVMDNMVDYKTAKMNNSELRDIKTQGLFISNSLIKSISRLILSKKQTLARKKNEKLSSVINTVESNIYITNTVYVGFEKGLFSFILEEDLKLDVKSFLDEINQNPELAIQEGGYFYKEVLKNITTDEISITELIINQREYTKDNPNEFDEFGWPNGSTHGCCGNYSGPCLYFHWACYVHDKICKRCNLRWFCLSGCIPDKELEAVPYLPILPSLPWADRE